MKRTGLKPGRKSLERGSTFKVPRAAMKRKRRPRRTEQEAKESLAFKTDFVGVPCAVCGTFWPYPDVHHVVAQQELKRRGLVHRLWDAANGLPLCPIGARWGEDCHERHENASRRVPLSALTEQNLEFAREVLGAAAGGYLERRYGKSSNPERSGPS